ncbi:MAG: DEAD/DEAH box helicase, partial [Chloroflexota bacterium]
MSSHPLDAFFPPVRQWFRETFGEPTPPQAQGWPAIQRGEHTLILAPTGSGKTLAAFLWGIDQILRDLTPQPPLLKGEGEHGVRLLYVSPLKALNNDIERNLRVPLDGIRETAARMTQRLPTIRVAVRTGDTPSSARAQMLKRPPHILITTPESLYLMLTSPKARLIFRTVRTVIVDEIHTLVGDKRGVHLSLSLERLCHLATADVQRIGLSATIKPLDEVARFLGGQTEDRRREMDMPSVLRPPSPVNPLVPRPVTIIDAGYRKPLDLQVVTAVEDFGAMPGGTVWPSVVPRVLHDIVTHRSTLIFANNRRLAERTADRLNAQLAAEQSEEIPPGSTEALAPGGVPRDSGMFAIGASGPIRAHHGSMSKEARREMEEDLKAGKLPALVGTSSLELGIDIGTVDLVVQLQSPKSVAQGLQRVGRSGHLVGQTSVGRIYATFREDLVEAAAVARGMLDGDVEPTSTPQNPLDVLAQQIVAIVSVEEWNATELFDLVRRTYAYRDLTRATFDLVLEMLSGKYRDIGSNLRARIAWDRGHDRLSALPGSRLLALSNAGTISDRGAYGVYLGDGKTKIGELDEEFVFETRVGNTFLLGSQTWRVLDIQQDRVLVGDAAGAMVRMPFWRGDYPWRTYDLGVRIGRFRREVVERLRGDKGDEGRLGEITEWLQRDYRLDDNSARNLIAHVRGQMEATGVISSDKTIVLESTEDAMGARVWVIHSPFGGRVNGAWALALTSVLREQVGIEVETQTDDDGILFRFPRLEREPTIDLVRLTPADARERILRELPDSALFGAHFRMNAARALLLPRASGQKRTPFWLQRLKAKDLLAIVRRLDDFPIIAETYRDCLRDVLDLPHLEEVLSQIQSSAIAVVPIETITPSPIAAGLLFNFASVYMYEWDAPKAERQLQTLTLRRDVLADLLGEGGTALSELLKPAAVTEVAERAQHIATGFRARSMDELAQHLYELGDLTTDEVVARCDGDGRAWLAQLSADGRAVEVEIPTRRGVERRWVDGERVDEYRTAFAPAGWTHPADVAADMAIRCEQSQAGILLRLFHNSGPLTRDALLDRYAFDEAWLDATLTRLVETNEIARGRLTREATQDEFVTGANLEKIHQRTLTILRKEIQPVSLFAYADFLARWQHAHPHARADDVRPVMEQLRGVTLPGVVWERDVLPVRVRDYDSDVLDALVQSGDVIWVGSGRDPKHARVRFVMRGDGALFLNEPDISGLSESMLNVYTFLKSEGASFTADIEAGVSLARKATDDALVELVLAGLVTNDSFDTLRSLLDREQPQRAPAVSALETELAARMTSQPRVTSVRIPSIAGRTVRAAKRRVRARLETKTASVTPQGRWSLVHRAVVMGKPLSDDERADQLARILLARYGVLTRDALEREEFPLDWAALYP